MDARLILKEIGSRVNNIGTIVDTDPNNDEIMSDKFKQLKKQSKVVNMIGRISSLETKA